MTYRVFVQAGYDLFFIFLHSSQNIMEVLRRSVALFISLIVACGAVYVVFSNPPQGSPVVLDALGRCTESGSTVAEVSTDYAVQKDRIIIFSVYLIHPFLWSPKCFLCSAVQSFKQ